MKYKNLTTKNINEAIDSEYERAIRSGAEMGTVDACVDTVFDCFNNEDLFERLKDNNELNLILGNTLLNSRDGSKKQALESIEDILIGLYENMQASAILSGQLMRLRDKLEGKEDPVTTFSNNNLFVE